MLPPRAYRALKSSLSPEDMADDEDINEDGDDGDDSDDEHDETYKRIKGILEDLLENGRRALRGDDVSSIHSAPTDAETDDEHLTQRNPTTFSQVAASEDDSEKDPSRNDGEEAVVMGGDEQNAMSLPPITVTIS